MTGLDVLPDVLLTLARVGLLALAVAAPAYLLADWLDGKARTGRDS